jgi:hypothetical protein
MATQQDRERSLWHIGTGAEDYFLLPRGALRANDRPIEWSEDGAQRAVASWWLDGVARMQLLMILMRFGAFDLGDEAAQRRRLAQLLQSGVLVALRRAHDPLPQTESDDDDDDDHGGGTGPRPPEKTWIEVELVTAAGQPFANRRVRLELPDGTTVERTTDAQGLCRADGIDPGTCKVTLLDVDKVAWRPA